VPYRDLTKTLAVLSGGKVILVSQAADSAVLVATLAAPDVDDTTDLLIGLGVTREMWYEVCSAHQRFDA
jgi:hypothetical protein